MAPVRAAAELSKEPRRQLRRKWVCTVQNDTATGSSNTCYANGVKEINVHDVETDDRALTVTKGSSTCFSTAFNGNDVYVAWIRHGEGRLRCDRGERALG